MNTEFLYGGIAFRHNDTCFPVSTDSVLLADFAADGNGNDICDLCAGSGSIGFLLCSREPDCRVTAVELRENAAALMRANILNNRLESRMEAVCGDLRDIASLLPGKRFDRVVCNPPYFPVGSGPKPKDEDAAVARTELCCTVSDFCGAAARLLRSGGGFYLVHKPERLTDLLCALRAAGLEPKLLRFVRNRQGQPPSLLLLRAVSGGKPGLNVMPDMLLSKPDGTPTEEYLKIYRMEE